MKPFSFFLAACAAALCAQAAVTPAGVFTDHMVLQREKPVRVWGTAAPGEAVAIDFAGASARTVASSDGGWMLELPTMAARGEPSELVIKGPANTVTLSDVLVGEVWVASGQSNMYWPVKDTTDAAREIAESANSQIRLLSMPRVSADEPQKTVQCAWEVCGPQTVPTFSGTAYYFARDLQKALKVPVGIIHASWGGSPVEAWVTRETLRSDPAFQPVFDRYDAIVKTYAVRKADYDKRMAKWEADCKAASAAGKKLPPRPRGAVSPDSQVKLAGPYNGMIAPLLPMSLRGVIWYQGEANAGRAATYEALFKKLIAQWRADFRQGDIPFYFVQLANYEAPRPEEENYVWMRQYQKAALAVPHTGMAVVIDAGEAKNIHWPHKQVAGNRLALIALANDYGKDVEYSGPVLERAAVVGQKMQLEFSHADGLSLKDGGADSFTVAGEDQKFAPARAEVKDGALWVWSEAVPAPRAVRYAWKNAPQATLFNAAGLPASPFRTDDWPRVFLPYTLAF